MSDQPAVTSAYKKVITGGLKFKGDAGPVKKRIGNEKALALERGPGFKPKVPATVKPETNVAAPAAAATAASSTAKPDGHRIFPPVVLSEPVGRSGWALHKDELHEIDANLAALREHDKAVERLEGQSKKEIVEREKKAVEQQVAMMVQQSQLAPGVKFSVPHATNLNKEYLYRKEASVSHATAALDARAKKKADRYCK